MEIGDTLYEDTGVSELLAWAVTKLLKVKPFNRAAVPEFQYHDTAKGMGACSVIPLSIVSEEGAKKEMVNAGRRQLLGGTEYQKLVKQTKKKIIKLYIFCLGLHE